MKKKAVPFLRRLTKEEKKVVNKVLIHFERNASFLARANAQNTRERLLQRKDDFAWMRKCVMEGGELSLNRKGQITDRSARQWMAMSPEQEWVDLREKSTQIH